MPRLYHLHSRYARLNDELIDVTLEHVRAADEVLFGCDVLDARDMIRVASAVLDAERDFARNPAQFLELEPERRSDWTLACMAESFAQASTLFEQRGSNVAAARARADQRSALRRIVDSPFRSPLVGYDAVLIALRHDLPPPSPAELLELQRLALAEALRSEQQDNVLSLLRDIADSQLRLGQLPLALITWLAVVRYDPTAIWTHNHLAISLGDRFPALAHAAATRALRLMPREDKHGLRPQLRGLIEKHSRSGIEPTSGIERALLEELHAPPGKRSRSSLRSLCMQLVPEVAEVPEKQPEALPDSAAFAQLRRDLQRLPLPPPQIQESRSLPPLGALHSQPLAAGAPRAPQGKVGRNELCPCGTGRKWKRCCGAR